MSTQRKIATLPPIRVEQGLRDAAESVLGEDESLSSFIEAAVRSQVQARRERAAFHLRGLQSAKRAQKTGEYRSTEQVIHRLQGILEAAKARKGRA